MFAGQPGWRKSASPSPPARSAASAMQEEPGDPETVPGTGSAGRVGGVRLAGPERPAPAAALAGAASASSSITARNTAASSNQVVGAGEPPRPSRWLPQMITGDPRGGSRWPDHGQHAEHVFADLG
jgi:hypothetical protein